MRMTTHPAVSPIHRLCAAGLWLAAVWPSPGWAAKPASAPVAPAPVAAKPPPLRDAQQLGAVVGGIISYTRWPHSPNPVRLCVLGHPGLVGQFPLANPAVPGQRPVTAHLMLPGAELQRDCDALYVTAMPSAANYRALLRQVIGGPVLTMGEGAEFCSDGGMFCFESQVSAPSHRFSANLDAIARSGLRVNPQVLRLARPPKGQTP